MSDWLFVTPWTVACQAPLSIGLSRQEYWNELPFPFSGYLPHPGIEPMSPAPPALAGEYFTTMPPGKPPLYSLIAYEYYNQFNSVVQSCLTLCDPMDCSTPVFPVHYQLPELVQTHVYQVGDAIQPSHPLSSPFPLAFNLFQHQGLLQRVSSLHQVAKVLEFQLQSFQWIFRVDFLWDWLVWSPSSPRDSQESSPTSQSQKHLFSGTQFSLWSNSHIHTWLLEKP